jgi:hypothetical protein
MRTARKKLRRGNSQKYVISAHYEWLGIGEVLPVDVMRLCWRIFL